MGNIINYLFTNNVAENLRFSKYSHWHWIYLAAIVVFGALLISIIGKKSGKDSQRLVKSLAIASVCVHAAFCLSEFFRPGMEIFNVFPFQLCDTSPYLFLLAVLTKNKTMFAVTFALMIPGGIIAVLTPVSKYNAFGAFSYYVFSFFATHFFVIFMPLLAIKAGFFTPRRRDFPKVITFAVCYAGLMYTFNKLIGSNYLYLNYPEKETPLEIAYNYLGNPGYVLPVLFLAIVFILIMLEIAESAHKRANKTKEAPKNAERNLN